MIMNTLKNYSKLISTLPLSDQAFSSNHNTWTKYRTKNQSLSRAIGSVFQSSQKVTISRQDLFESGDSERINEFTLKTIIWGYPNGLRGNNFNKIAKHYDNLVDHLKETKSKNDLTWKNQTAFLDSFDGLGLSTFSKFLYFLNLNINDYRCLILDLQLIRVFQNSNFSETQSLRKIKYNNAIKNYSEYLKSMKKWSKEIGVAPDQLEMFFFIFGSNLKHK